MIKFKDEIKELRKNTIEIHYRNLYNKIEQRIIANIKKNVSNIENLAHEKIFCNIDFDTDDIKISNELCLKIVNEVFDKLDIKQCISDIKFKHESNYQDSYYRLSFYYNVSV